MSFIKQITTLSIDVMSEWIMKKNVVSLLKPIANTLWLPVEHMKTKQCTSPKITIKWRH